MSENAFTQAEEKLADKILGEIFFKIDIGVIAYSQQEDREAAAQAVIQLLKERLNDN
jgi:hypothetical protein